MDVLFVSMEPSVAGWAPTMAQARARIDDGFRDWGGVALHYAVERELLGGRIRNYLYTNLAKCALPTAVARATAGRRWQNCFPHLQSEIETFNPKWIVAMGGKSYQFLKRSLPEWSGRISKIFHHGWNRMNAIRARLAREGAILLPGVASIRRFAEEFHDRTGRRPVKEAWSLYRLQAALYVTELRELKKTINMGKVC